MNPRRLRRKHHIRRLRRQAKRLRNHREYGAHPSFRLAARQLDGLANMLETFSGR